MVGSTGARNMAMVFNIVRVERDMRAISKMDSAMDLVSSTSQTTSNIDFRRVDGQREGPKAVMNSLWWMETLRYKTLAGSNLVIKHARLTQEAS